MTQSSTHSYDCTGFMSICCHCGCWNWSLRLSYDGFFAVYDCWCKMAALGKLFWKNELLLIIRLKERVSTLCLPSRSWKHQKHKAASMSPESLVSSHSALRADWVHTEDRQRVGPALTAMQRPHQQFCLSGLPLVQSVPGVKPSRHSPEMRTIKLSYETNNNLSLF